MGDLYNRLKARKRPAASGRRPGRYGSSGAEDALGRRESAEGREAAAERESAGERVSAGERETSPVPEGFRRVGEVFVRRELIPPGGGESPLLRPGDPVSLPLRLRRGAESAEEITTAPASRSAESHLFYDIEATGLSTGAGNVAFLLGIGRVTEQGFELLQWLLPDYPYEPELLTAVFEHIEQVRQEIGDVTLVSYNGRSFDTPLLKTRMLMNGLPFDPPRELDLLPVSRRLWRRSLENCSLGTIEEGILALHREVDLPGALVPLRYFDYLETGRPELLTELLAHHRQDILSLYRLLSLIETLLRREPAAARATYDRFELARLLLEQAPVADARRRGEELLRELVTEGSEERGAYYYGWYLRRRGDLRQALEVWRGAFETTGSVASGIMAAKLLEHRFRGYREALELVEAILENGETGGPTGKGGERVREALRYRRERLRRRIASS